MKKSLLASAVLSALCGVASAQTSITLYGIADAGFSYKNNGAGNNAKTLSVDSGLQSGSRLGFKGTEDLGSGFSALFVLENGFTIDNGAFAQSTTTATRLFGRQAFVGLSNSAFGTVKLGRQYNPIRPALESVDPFGFGLAGNISGIFNAYGERADNTINYTSPLYNGFSGQVAYSFGEVNGSTSTGRQAGLSAGYANGPLSLILAYHNQNLVTGTPATTPNGNAKTTLIGGTYDFRVVKAHAAYAFNKGDGATGAKTVDSRDMMAGLSVPLGQGALLASYMRKNDRLVSDGNTGQWSLGYTFDVSKRTNFYWSYAKVKNDRAATVGTTILGSAAVAGNDPSTFNVGIRHKF